MAISYSSEGYKVTPQFANLGALQGLQPLDVTRKATFEPRPLAPIEVYSSRPELVAQGLAQGIQSAVSGVTEGIKAHYSEKKEQAKEERKFERQVELEKAKQTTENLSFINQERVKLAATKGLEKDYKQQDDALVTAAKRIMGVLPSGYKQKETEKTNDSFDKKPIDTTKSLSEQNASIDDQGRVITNAIPLPGEVISTAEQPLQGFAYQREMQEKEQQENKTPTETYVGVDDSTIAKDKEFLDNLQLEETKVTSAPQAPVAPPVVIQPAQPAGQPTQELTGIQPVTPQGGVVPAPVEFNRPEQPKDPKLPRDLRSYVYMPDESSNAYQAAAELTTPYRKVSVEQNPRTKEYFLKQEDASAEVLKMQSEAQEMGINAEELALKKHQIDLSNQDQANKTLEANRKIVKEDKSYRDSLKDSINKQANKIDLIEDAIKRIQSNPDLVGIYSQYLRGKEPIGGFNYQNIAAIAKGAGYSGPMEKIQKIVDIEQSLKSIEFNLGWEEFAKMKQLSPTGSAGVGGLTEGERQSLERISGPLDITSSPEQLIGTLYNLRNGAIKTITNASNEVESADKTFKRPIYNSLRMNPNDESRIKILSDGLGKATEEQKTNENYLNALEELKNLIRKRDRIKEFNAELGQTFRNIK
jgi:hypothetical protein